MRTTIEILDHQRAKLLEIAARRGLKGFSVIVQEAIDKYLAECSPQGETVRAALAVLGTLGARDADSLEASVREVRRKWR